MSNDHTRIKRNFSLYTRSLGVGNSGIEESNTKRTYDSLYIKEILFDHHFSRLISNR